MKPTTLVLTLAAIASITLPGAETVFTPFDNPQGNSENHTGMWLRPNLGKAEEVLPLKTRLWATKESVTGGVALKCVFEKGAVGLLTFEKDTYPPSAGLTFYAKASKPLKLLVNKTVTVEAGTEWKKIDVPWEKLGTTREKPTVAWQFFLKVLTPIDERTTLIIDRLGVEAPEFDPNPKIDPQTGPDATFSSKDMLYGAENLSKTLEKLKAKQAFKVIAFGDSITAGAQMTRGSWEVKPADGVQYLYFSHFARLLEKHFGYTGIKPMQFGHGGWTAEAAMKVIDAEVIANCEAGDLVILEFGGNDMTWNKASPAEWKKRMKALIAKVKTKTDQILLYGPGGGSEMFKIGKETTQVLQELVAEEKLAAADVGKLFLYRGEPYAWALLANEYHPDFMGHLSIGEMIAPILTGEHKTYPE
jgi:hypothetical protein